MRPKRWLFALDYPHTDKTGGDGPESISSSPGYCWLTQKTAVATAINIRMKTALASAMLSRLPSSL
ncbi:hypothetical protein [Pseudomonas borbori]|uniref:hypothetical protein n=1 Tax=Pseudomonas borbori TaxID=289003 RepID=UPI0014813704|nr:hypothetical protein [Pseudomonas borbori]